jgi:anion-transporting  ArsA/GET3 family ATPase
VELKRLLDSSLLLVTGKGGTGKTTFSAALAEVASGLGKSVVVCELGAQNSELGPIFGVRTEFEPRQAHENLAVCNLDWSGGKRAWIHNVVRVKKVASMLENNALLGKFLDFVPGSHAMVTLSGIATLTADYDLVIVDMPASGHAFSTLDVLRTVVELFSSGPIFERAQQIKRVFESEAAHVVFVALPEEMVINETLEFFQRIADGRQVGGDAHIFLNRATQPTLTEQESELIDAMLTDASTDQQREFLLAGKWEESLELSTHAALSRLEEMLGHKPMMIAPVSGDGLAKDVVRGVAVALGRTIGLTRREMLWN